MAKTTFDTNPVSLQTLLKTCGGHGSLDSHRGGIS